MKDPSCISSLARKSCASGMIRFIHFRDGKEHKFYSVVNDMSGDRLSAFDGDPPTINDSLKWVRSVFRDIRRKSTKVLEDIGDF